MGFGTYILRERIATGGMAEIFDALLVGDAGFERRVAVKRILPELAADESFLSMFVDEAKIAVQLSHSNIAQILELGWADGSYYIVLEYVDGKELKAIVKAQRARGQGLPIPIACHVAMCVAEALAHAHGAIGRDGRPLAVIHRDLSPHNVMVSYDGAVKVIDFGLAKARGRITKTAVGVLKGKLSYMSPEQAAGEQLDARSDIFSLGACFFEMLTGQMLFQRESDRATYAAVCAARIPALREFVPSLPIDLERVIRRALTKDPQGRWQTAQDFYDAIESIAYDRSLLVHRREVVDYLAGLFPRDDQPKAAGATQRIRLDELDGFAAGVGNSPALLGHAPAPTAEENLGELITTAELDDEQAFYTHESLALPAEDTSTTVAPFMRDKHDTQPAPPPDGDLASTQAETPAIEIPRFASVPTVEDVDDAIFTVISPRDSPRDPLPGDLEEPE
jgi:eukaryotic-like serine/threonine-protein kinase